MSVVLLRMTLAMALVHHGADRARGYDGFRALRETCVRERFALNMLPLFEVYLAREQAEQGEVDTAIQRWRAVAEELEHAGAPSNLDLPLIFMAEAVVVARRLRRSGT